MSQVSGLLNCGHIPISLGTARSSRTTRAGPGAGSGTAARRSRRSASSLGETVDACAARSARSAAAGSPRSGCRRGRSRATRRIDDAQPPAHRLIVAPHADALARTDSLPRDVERQERQADSRTVHARPSAATQVLQRPEHPPVKPPDRSGRAGQKMAGHDCGSSHRDPRQVAGARPGIELFQQPVVAARAFERGPLRCRAGDVAERDRLAGAALLAGGGDLEVLGAVNFRLDALRSAR